MPPNLLPVLWARFALQTVHLLYSVRAVIIVQLVQVQRLPVQPDLRLQTSLVLVQYLAQTVYKVVRVLQVQLALCVMNVRRITTM